ncbi:MULTISPECIES: galactokinase [Rhodococcus]|uniref:Galactokinase n=1 Tax=Rhodococcus qingshengii TaxID=334542 RepID=A0A2A5JGI8_RHOSG|nr:MULTISPECIES: galactokinase [Rhodococcus]MDF3316991.1 galactokinase [Rhodococcus sp. C3V]MDI9958698.1 galactokinase [Rhodococcus sp. IEGM 1237]MDI9966003.1 galactokinase [Rhodococcus sp. IEGM 1251]MDV8128161.1 galactokinase [Rhodococcus sp. IEGM 1304]PCK28081.1 galactokinase [Rhodococcus qingshengii]
MDTVSNNSVLQQFHATYGYPATGVWAAPGRVNLIGEHTDYNGGLCLPVALEQRTLVAVALRSDGVVRVHSRQSAETYTGPLGDIATGWAAYPTAVLWSLARRGLPIEGIDLAVDSSVPVGAGLSSSAALTCSVALAVNELHDSPFARDELVQVCIQAENDGVGAPTGGMDQTIALFAQPSTALLLDCQDGSTEPIPFELHGAGYELIVIDTRVKHSLADGQYGMRRSQCVAAAAALGVGSLREATADQAETVRDPILRARARHVVTEIERTRKTAELLRSSRFSDVGELFDNSHASLRDDFEVSCDELDVAVAAARRGGAIGARMTGGGFGGSAIALVPEGSGAEVIASVSRDFAARGWRAPHFLGVVAGGSAARL